MAHFGLLLDIDGVIVRGRKVISHAVKAFQKLVDSKGRFRVPTIFVTNAGNSRRQDKADQLSKWLGVHITEQQVVMSHSPLRMFQQFHDKHCLISGQGPIVDIAHGFGHGAFLVCLENLYKKVTGRDMIYTALIGKPSEITYLHAESCVQEEAHRLGITHPVRRLFAIGDNINTDIYGANLYNRYLERRRKDDFPKAILAAGSNSARQGLNSSMSKDSQSTVGMMSNCGAVSCTSVLVHTGVYNEDLHDDACEHTPRDFLPVEVGLKEPVYRAQATRESRLATVTTPKIAVKRGQQPRRKSSRNGGRRRATDGFGSFGVSALVSCVDSVSKKRSPTSYRGHELKGKLSAKKCSRDVYRHRETAASSQGEDRQWLCVNGFWQAKWSKIPKKFVTRCIPVVWSFLQACVSLGCLFLVLLFFHPTCLDSKELQVEALALTLRQHLVGQDIAINRTVTAIARYLNSSESTASVPLVLVYVGCSGCGKTYASSLIAKHYPYTEALVASHKIALTRKTGNDLLHWLRYSLSSWRPNVIVIDDVDLGLDTVRPSPLDDPFSTQLETVLSSWEKARWETTEDIEKLIEAYRSTFPLWLRNAEIVPFLPLTKDHVKECLLRQLAEQTPQSRAKILALSGSFEEEEEGSCVATLRVQSETGTQAACTKSRVFSMDVLQAGVPAQVSSIHCHKNQSDEVDVDLSARRRLICASILCLTFMLFELIGGILANSLAIATDAAHLLTDFASFMISLFSLWMGARPATKRLSFGWYRAEVIGALTSVIMIWAVTGVLVYMAIQRMISKEYNIDATIMLISASVGVVVNIIMGVALQIHPTSPLGHSHGSEDSARRFELASTEPFVPHGGSSSEMDSSRQYSHLNVFRGVGSRTGLGTGTRESSLQSMSPQHIPEVGTSGHSASAPSMSSPPYNPSAPETPSAHHTDTPGRDEAVTLQNHAAEQRGAMPNAGPSWSQQAKSSSGSEDNDALDSAAVRSGMKRHFASSANGNVSDNALTAPGTAAVAAPVDGQLGVSQHDPGTSPPDGQDVQKASNNHPESATTLAQSPPQLPRGAVALPEGTVSQVPPPETGNVAAIPDMPAPRSSRESRGVMNINVRAAFIHVLGDLIQSVGVLIAAIVIYFCPSCGVVDPVCTLMFSVIVLVTTLTILREALNVLMEGIPHSVDYHQVKRLLLSVDGVARVHDLHIWALSLDKLAVSAHVVLVPGADAMSVRRNASRMIRRNFDVFKLTLQMEEFEEGIRQHCRRCSELS
ncbi:hypothetical protein HPB52_007427 [Rhipicephalus sanguineus]|uniref:Uncharacterized protein n=1 Tax=Rhipicephalus sanguineus TaxID=34632 RepID=A0A9D4PME6_RHISA|nr:hypothetical protein HPB52_007427 [Rhipicephalus sanguineus]